MKRKFCLVDIIEALKDEVRSVAPSNHLDVVILDLQQKASPDSESCC